MPCLLVRGLIRGSVLQRVLLVEVWVVFLARVVPRSGLNFRGVGGSVCSVGVTVFHHEGAPFRVSFPLGASCTVGCLVSGIRARFVEWTGGASANDTLFLV